MANTINFRNLIQVALWDEELSGQISDGFWENARPYDHYKVWCTANAKVDRKNLGVNFWADKSNYDLCSSQLLGIEVVAERMLKICQAVAGQGFTMKMMKNELRDMKQIIKMRAAGTPTWAL
jgi:hypothetical protein